MNTPVSFELAKLLKEKGFNLYCRYSYWENELTNHTPGYPLEDGTTSQKNYWDFERYYAPTIAEVVMWLYEKYGIWIQVSISRYGIFYCNILKKENTRSLDNPISWEMQVQLNDFNSPREAYSAGIEYCLTTLL